MSKHYAIKCTNCAAPLDILGGGRVSTVTCSYCHSMLDMNDHYKVLTKFNNAKDALGDFQIGMRGNIKGVEWTIIGWIAYRTAEFPAEEWDEFFLYSPTHGYAWLIDENNKLYFSKKVRDFDLLTWQEKKPKTLFYYKGHYLQKEASYLTYIDYVEGELNWVAKFGDTFTTWDYDGVGFQVLNIEKTSDEIEVYHTERLDKFDIYSAFGLEYTQKSQTTIKNENDTDIYTEKIEDKPSYDGWKVLFLILMGVILLSFFNTKTVKSFYVNDNNATQVFTINSNAFLTEIDIQTPLGLRDSKLTIYKNKTKVFYIDTKNVYYIAKYLSHNWSHTSIRTKLYLKLKKGTYSLQFQRSSDYQKSITITINETFIRLKYILPIFILITLVILYSYRYYFNFGWKLITVPIILIIIILGVSIIDEDFIYGVVVFAYFIYDNFSSDEDYDD